MKVSNNTELDAIEHEGRLAVLMERERPDKLVLEAPDWYWSHEGHVSVMTPWGTHIAYNKRSRSRRPLSGRYFLGSYIEDRGTGEKHPELQPDLIALKAWGEPRRYYRVVVTESTAEAWGFDMDADWVVSDDWMVVA